MEMWDAQPRPFSSGKKERMDETEWTEAEPGIPFADGDRTWYHIVNGSKWCY